MFEPGDLLISLRNVNAVLVVDPDDYRLKFLTVGRTMRQHDADFVGGDRISVFDNRNFTLAPEARPAASRVVEFDARSGAMEVLVDGTGEYPFFTQIMGVHQRLENGNILVVSSGEGRVLEFTPEGHLAWRYENRIKDRTNDRIYMAQILPQEMDEAFFEERRKACER